MTLQCHTSGSRERPEDHKISLSMPFEGGRIFVEIPAPGFLFSQDADRGRKLELIRRAIDTLREAIPAQ